MPGRNDFAIIRARMLADDRVHDAARRYVATKLASKRTALAAVVGHVAMVALWASRETDNGVLPGDGIGVVSVSIMSPHDDAVDVVTCLLGARLLRKVKGGLYVVGFTDCYRGLLNRRKRDRRAAAEARKRKAPSASARRRADVGTTSARRRRRTSDVHPTIAAAPDRTGPDRTGPSPPTPASAAGGPSTSSSEERNGRGAAHPPPAVALSSADRAVFEALWRRLTRCVEPFAGSRPLHEGGRWKFPTDYAPGRRAMELRASIDAKAPDVPGIVAFVEEFETATPDVMTETQNIRRTKAMSRKQRTAG